jgi:hypothetical protein
MEKEGSKSSEIIKTAKIKLENSLPISKQTGIPCLSLCHGF